MDLRIINKVSIIGSISIAIFYFIIFFQYSINAPIWDEYYTVIEFFNQFLELHSFTEKLISFFTFQHNGHRLFLDNILLIGHYYVTGFVNFQALTFLGNCMLIGIVALLFKQFLTDAKGRWMVLPVTVLVINFQYYQNTFMEIASIQFFGVILLVFLSLTLLLHNKPVYFITAILTGALGLFTGGNGPLLLPIGTLLLISLKEYKKSVVWFFVFGAFTLLYTHNLKKGWGTTDISLIENLFFNFSDVFIFFCQSLSGPLYPFFHSEVVITICGIFILIGSVYLIVKLLVSKDYLLLAFLLTILATLFLIAISRLQIAKPIESRYNIYGSILYSLLFIAFFRVRNKQASTILIVSSYALVLFYFIMSYVVQLPYIQNWYERAAINQTCIMSNPSVGYGYRCPEQGYAKELLAKSDSLGYYSHKTEQSCGFSFGENDFTVLKESEGKLINDNSIIGLGGFQKTDEFILFDGWCILTKDNHPENDRFLVLTNIVNGNSYVFSTHKVIYPGIDFSQKTTHDYVGFEKVLSPNQLPKGTYSLGVLVRSFTTKKEYYKFLHKKITI
ncbi:MAG: hypothetical protein AB8B61_06945 [Cyclobacteriaceae bacterium]